MWTVFHDFFTTVKNTSPLSRSRSHNFQKRITPNFYLRLVSRIIVETAMASKRKEGEGRERGSIPFLVAVNRVPDGSP